MLIDTGKVPEMHPVRQAGRKRKVDGPQFWLLSKTSEPHSDYKYCLTFAYATDLKTGELERRRYPKVESDSLEELIQEARQHGLRGFHGIV